MIGEYITKEYLDLFILQALGEDLGDGDHSTLATIGEVQEGAARLIFKEEGVVVGIALAKEIYRRFDPSLELDVQVADGQHVKKGDIGFVVRGKVRSILSTERIVLNCLQRLSGVATYTRRLVEMVEGTGAKILDTRKTTPGWRPLEKWAVKMGGGVNHRFGLFDMIMLKDNHIDYAGGIAPAVQSARSYLKSTNRDLKIEVETRNLDEVREALDVGADIIMFDNMTPENMKEAVKLVGGKVPTEASGGITEDTLRGYAETGVDFISIGALTHSIKSLDISLKAVFL